MPHMLSITTRGFNLPCLLSFLGAIHETEQREIRGAALVILICGVAYAIFWQPPLLILAVISSGIICGLIARNGLEQYDFWRTIERIMVIVQRKLPWAIPITGVILCGTSTLIPLQSTLLGLGFGFMCGATWKTRQIVQLVQ